MIIFGAKGFAEEVLEIVCQKNQLEYLVFYDDYNDDLREMLYEKFPILKSLETAKNYIKNIDCCFTIAIENPILRKKIYDKFIEIGGQFNSTISNDSKIGTFDLQIGIGANKLSGSIFSNGTKSGKGCIVYYNLILTDDFTVGDFVEISPNVTLLGGCVIGSYSQIGLNATILPKVRIGDHVIIVARSIVTKDVPDNSLVVGVPGVLKNYAADVF